MKTIEQLKKELNELRGYAMKVSKKNNKGLFIIDEELLSEMNELKKQIAILKGE